MFGRASKKGLPEQAHTTQFNGASQAYAVTHEGSGKTLTEASQETPMHSINTGLKQDPYNGDKDVSSTRKTDWAALVLGHQAPYFELEHNNKSLFKM